MSGRLQSGRDMEMARFLEEDGKDFELVPATTRAQRMRSRAIRLVLGVTVVGALVGAAFWTNDEPNKASDSVTADETIEEWGKKPSWPMKPKPKSGKSLAQQMKEAADRKVINKAKTKYSEDAARAYAMISKLSYCGNTPGIYAAMSSSCSNTNLYGTVSACEKAKFSLVPGMVRTISIPDMGEIDAYFAVVAKMTSSEEGAPQNEIMVSVRGSTNTYASGERDKDTQVDPDGLEGCEGCNVHKGYHDTYDKMEPYLLTILNELSCYAGGSTSASWFGDCTIHLTGHGSGSAVASMFAWELTQMNYTVGTSYLFSTPEVGGKKFAAAMNKLFNGDTRHGPVFQVTYGKDSVPLWPYNTSYVSWGLEAYYASENKTAYSATTKYKQLCMSDNAKCGLSSIPKDQLTSEDSCKNPLAPAGDFCTLTAYNEQCYSGMGFEQVSYFNNLWGTPTDATSSTTNSTSAIETAQPYNSAAAWWHPSSSNGAAAAAKKNDHKPEHYYSEKVLKAFAALSKAAYCGNSMGTKSVIQSTCSASAKSVCGKAGFGVVPQTVQSVGVNWPEAKDRDTLYFFTAMIRRSSATYAESPYFMPAEACVLVFRGSANQENMEMNLQTKQIPLNDTTCGKCTANAGILNAWNKALEPKVLDALKKSGCAPNPSKTQTDKVIVAGHSMGGTMTTLATYQLNKLGFNVQLSWAFEAGRPGNPALMQYVDEGMVSSDRPVALWHVTHENDFVARYPRSVYNKDSQGVGRYMFQVHYGEKGKNATLCTTKKEAMKGAECGILQYPRNKLSTTTLPNEVHCGLSYAPSGQMCMLQGYGMTSPYRILTQCSFGGAI